jgi:hypothetical protein
MIVEFHRFNSLASTQKKCPIFADVSKTYEEYGNVTNGAPASQSFDLPALVSRLRSGQVFDPSTLLGASSNVNPSAWTANSI